MNPGLIAEPRYSESHTPPACYLYGLGRRFGKNSITAAMAKSGSGLEPSTVSVPFPSVSSQTTGAASDIPHPWEGTLGSPFSIYPEAPLPVPLAEPILSLPTKFQWWFPAKAAPGAKMVRKGRGAFLAQMAGISVS